MANYYGSPNPQQASYNAQNLQFYPSSYGNPVSGHTTPAQAQYGNSPYGQSGGQASGGYGYGGPTGFMNTGFGQPGSGVSGRMGEQGGLRTGWLAAFGTEGYETEPPLLEELGVNFGHIKDKTLVVLNPFSSIPSTIENDTDLFGPIIFCVLFGTFLLLSGKVHFGYIYGLGLIGSVSLHFIFSLMSNPQLDTAHSAPSAYGVGANYQGHDPQMDGTTQLTFFRSCSVLGYCLLPLVLTSFVGIGMNLDTLVGYLLTMASVAWCTYSSSGMFCAVGKMRSMRPLVAYPLMLFYVGFGIMGIFSSRGSGTLAGRTVA